MLIPATLQSGWAGSPGGFDSLHPDSNLIFNRLQEGIEKLGTGVFTQTGGTTTATSNIYIAKYVNNTGTYDLNGGTLSAQAISLGQGKGTFNYTAGTLTTQDFNINNPNSTVSLVNTQGISRFNIGNGNVGSLTIGSGASYIFPEMTVAYTNHGTVDQNAGSSNTVTNLYIGRNNGANGTYNLNGGTLSVGQLYYGASNSAFLYVNGGTFNLEGISNGVGSSYLYLNGGTFNLTGNTMDVDTMHIANGSGKTNSWSVDSSKNVRVAGGFTIGNNNGTGTMTQTGGTVRAGTLYLGNGGASASGTYNLQGGVLSTNNEYLSDTGRGTFNQTGGSHYTNSILVGYYGSGRGDYNLSDGVFSADTIYIGSNYDGYYGTGVFTPDRRHNNSDE